MDDTRDCSFGSWLRHHTESDDSEKLPIERAAKPRGESDDDQLEFSFSVADTKQRCFDFPDKPENKE